MMNRRSFLRAGVAGLVVVVAWPLLRSKRVETAVPPIVAAGDLWDVPWGIPWAVGVGTAVWPTVTPTGTATATAEATSTATATATMTPVSPTPSATATPHRQYMPVIQKD